MTFFPWTSRNPPVRFLLLQVQNQLPGAIFPYVFYPVKLPKSITMDSGLLTSRSSSSASTGLCSNPFLFFPPDQSPNL